LVSRERIIMLLPATSKINDKSHMVIGGCDVVDLKARYGTPLYIVDIATIKEQCRNYVHYFKFKDLESRIIYASKAFCPIAMCQLANNEGLAIDVSTGGELYTVLASGFSPEKIFYHGNNKSAEEIKYGLESGVGIFVVDNLTELETLNNLCKERNKKQKIMLRIAPGIKTYTHKYIQTGGVDSKFGFGLYNNIAFEAVKRVAEMTGVELIGLHAHIGSQIFNLSSYEKLIDVMISFISELKNKLKINITDLNIGGGLGIKYLPEDEPPTIKDFSELVYGSVKNYSEKYDVRIDKIYVEPGRSIVGNAGVTLYEIGNIKEIPKIRNYIAIDGGMSDNIRPLLYQAKYNAYIANRAAYINSIKDGEIISAAEDFSSKTDPAEKKYTIVGKHCESGDVIIEDIKLPAVNVGDLILVSATGAYCYAMSSNYNGQPKSAIVAVEDGKDYIWVKRQTYQDLINNDRKLYE
jgi:diaminopimelate decarboxylase